jgi:hypothetical protein
MTLKFHKVTAHIERLRKNALARATAIQAVLPKAQQALDAAARRDDLLERSRKEAMQGWNIAMLTGREPLGLRKPAPPTEPVTVVAVDGSQIYLDTHAASLFYALNIGHFIIRGRTGQTDADSEPAIVFEDDALYVEGVLITQAILNARRSVEEMVTLQRLAAREQASEGAPPVVALADGRVALRIDEKTVPKSESDALQERFFQAVDRLAEDGVPPAGYIARPGGSPVLSLLALALNADPDPTVEQIRTSLKQFRGLTDSALYETILAPGERSAVFESGAPWNTFYRDRAARTGTPSHSVHFFYVNVGRRYPVVARVEIPEWVAARPALVDRVHAALVEQSAVTLNDPYPYALIRADEEAFISGEEKNYLEEQMAVALIRDGLRVNRSEKLSHKARARRH